MARDLGGRVAAARKAQETGKPAARKNGRAASRPPEEPNQAPELATRKPTGAVPYPLVLIEGGEKTGKSYACAALSASKRVGRTFWLDIGEGAADEYGAIPGADYDILCHDGTWESIIGQVRAAKAEAQRAAAAGEPPAVLVVDSITAEWELLKDWASDRARKSHTNREKLARDPNAEVTVPMNCWNDAASRHRQLMTLLMTFPGIVAVTARGGEVAAVGGDGKPIEGQKAYRVEGHKSLAYDATVWVRLSHNGAPVVVGARSVHHGIRPGIDPRQTLPDDWSLEWLVFDTLRCDPEQAHVRDLVEPKTGVPDPDAMVEEACHPRTDVERLRELWRQAKAAGLAGEVVTSDTGDEEPLLAVLERLARERSHAPAGGGEEEDASEPAEAAS